MISLIARLKSKADDFLLSLCIMLVFLQHFFIAFGLPYLSSILYSSTFIIVGVWFIVKVADIIWKLIHKSNDSNAIKQHRTMVCLALVALIFFFSLLSVIIDEAVQIQEIRFDLDYYQKLIIFFQVIVFIFLCFSGNFSKFPLSLLKVTTCIFSLCLIVLFATGKARAWYGFQPWHQLTLNFHNPNACGILLSVVCCLLIYTIFSSRLLITKLLVTSILIIMCIFLFLTGCRSAMIGFAAFIFGSILCYFIKKNSLSYTVAVILVPLLFASIYLLFFLIYDSVSIYTPTTSMMTGKTYSTRYKIWLYALNSLNFNPFVGSYFATNNGQWHNTEIDLIVAFGFVPFVLTLILFAYIIRTLFTTFKNFKTCLAFGFVYLIFTLGSFEGFPFYSANSLALLSILFILACDDSYIPLSLHENRCIFRKCKVLLIGGKNSAYLSGYHAFLNNSNICSYYLPMCEARPSRCLNNRQKISEFDKWLSTIKIATLVCQYKPMIVELFDDSSISCRFLSKIFSKSKRYFVIHSKASSQNVGRLSSSFLMLYDLDNIEGFNSNDNAVYLDSFKRVESALNSGTNDWNQYNLSI